MASFFQKQTNLRQTSADTYTIGWHEDWQMGTTLNGGCITAAIYYCATVHLVTDPKLASRNQPDILKLHIDFLRPCVPEESTITVSILRTGAAISTLQLNLTQKGVLKVLTTVTSTNFDVSLGPSCPTAWSFLPPAPPKPDFATVIKTAAASAATDKPEPDANWMPAVFGGEVCNFTARLMVMYPRCGFPVDGITDTWHSFVPFGDGERIDGTYLALMSDVIPSMSDTLLRNGGMFDAYTIHKRMLEFSENNPGKTMPVDMDIKTAMRAKTHNATVTVDVEFKRRLTLESGLGFVHVRTAAKMMEGGRMDVDITMADEDDVLVATAHQTILVLEAQRKFRDGKSKENKGKASL